MVGSIRFAGISLSAHLVGLVLGFLAAGLYLKWARLCFFTRVEQEHLQQTYWNTGVVWFFMYKVSVVWNNPMEFIQHPIQLLLSVPNPNAWIPAALVSLMYFVWTTQKKKLGVRNVINALILVMTLGVSISSIFYFDLGMQTYTAWGYTIGDAKFHPIFMYRSVALFISFVMLHIVKDKTSVMIFPFPYVGGVVTGIALLIPTFFQLQQPVWIGISSVQWLSITLIGVGVTGLTSFRNG